MHSHGAGDIKDAERTDLAAFRVMRARLSRKLDGGSKGGTPGDAGWAEMKVRFMLEQLPALLSSILSGNGEEEKPHGVPQPYHQKSTYLLEGLVRCIFGHVTPWNPAPMKPS